ncbi:unnamed protein product [Durusdinium trenchii]|uniref:MATE family efflux transporter n=1 Tax=Durusdinium trenchii TaxID=1381693 RepID=A0ABP0J849_9DINO
MADNFTARLQRIFHLAWPSILSELSTPLLGLVDTVVVGHFADAEDLAALALAIAAYNPLIVVFNFLRMGFGGVIAQAAGARDVEELVACSVRGILLGLAVGLTLSMAREVLASLLFGMVLHQPDPETTMVAQSYFQCRILGAPAALSNYVVQAWLINVQRTDIAMAQNVLLNLCNAVLCVVLGYVLDGGIVGVAWATVLSNYLAFAFGVMQISRVAHTLPWDFTSLSAKLGSSALAANNLLMQLQMLISFGADGFANAGEALVGEAIGQGDPRKVRRTVQALLTWGFLLGLGFTLLFMVFGHQILGVLTSHQEVLHYASIYLPWQWAAPTLSFTAYLMDGVFVGAARPSSMRDATFLAMLVFCAIAHISPDNNLLWAAYMLHLITRAAVLGYWYPAVEDSASEVNEYRETLLAT